MDFAPHEQRVIDEHRDLTEKLNKLRSFFDTPTFRGLAGQTALTELVDKTSELIEHLQKTGRLAPCFNLPALDAARELTRKA